MRSSSLDEIHRSIGARMTDFGGWNMPLQYPLGTIAEHLECRRGSVVFDVSHLGSVKVTGDSSFGRLQRIFTNDLDRITPERAQYTHLLDESGSILDDIIVWWVAEQEFLVMPNASNTKRVLDSFGGEDVTGDRVLLAIQGPSSRERVTACFGDDAWVPRFAVRRVDIGTVSCTIAGTGYTGEEGVEIQVPKECAREVWETVIGAGVVPAGLGARDTLRLKAGLPLYGQELGPGITPLQAGLEWVVGWNKGDFRGRDALAAEKASGIPRKLFGIATEGRRPPRADSLVLSNGRPIGKVTSGNYSPVLEHGVALALLEPGCDVGETVQVRIRDVDILGRIVERPFVSSGRS